MIFYSGVIHVSIGGSAGSHHKIQLADPEHLDDKLLGSQATFCVVNGWKSNHEKLSREKPVQWEWSIP
jgi:hypothetical protein